MFFSQYYANCYITSFQDGLGVCGVYVNSSIVHDQNIVTLRPPRS